MSGSNCCFFTHMQVSQETGTAIWYSHLLMNFPQFVVIHTVKDFSVVNEAEVEVFLEFSCFFYDLMDVGNLISGSSVFPKSAWTSDNSQSMYCWNLSWRILSITLLACEMSAIVFEHSLALPFFGIGMKTGLFQSCGHCWVFKICWHIECSPFTASSFRTWNSSAGIPSPPLLLLLLLSRFSRVWLCATSSLASFFLIGLQ